MKDDIKVLLGQIKRQNTAIIELIGECTKHQIRASTEMSVGTGKMVADLFSNQNNTLCEYQLNNNECIVTCTKEILDKLDQIICSQVSID